jgi:hypothetical protein
MKRTAKKRAPHKTKSTPPTKPRTNHRAAARAARHDARSSTTDVHDERDRARAKPTAATTPGACGLRSAPQHAPS